MDEQFLHYIWKYQKFNTTEFILTNGQLLKVFYPGNHNHDSGPDFEEARIKIDLIEWAGQVEIHVKSSDWINHSHQDDEAYDSVILHVVWQHDKDIYTENEAIPTLELKGLIDPFLIGKYQQHIQSPDEILCASQIQKLHALKINSMLDRAAIERLKEKSTVILNHLKQTKNDWEQVTYQTIAANFGFSTNKEAFIRLTELLPFSKLKKVLQNAFQTEAILFGQAGFLETPVDPYQEELKSEFVFLSRKFDLQEPLKKVQWKYGKLRPANFPSVRLAQLSGIFHKHLQLFTLLTKSENIADLKTELLVDVSSYWQNHYDFGKLRKKTSRGIGQSSFENLLINSVSPILAAYSLFTNEQKYMDKAIDLLESISPENNRITKKWTSLDIKPKSALDSQALIQLHKSYCQKRRCLHCNIGVEILNK